MISVVMATYNEEKNILRCLESVQSFADEVIVVDGSSTDRTTDLAEAAGAKIISTTNKPNFHINKQMAMDAAKGELVLQMDADEVVDTELQNFIVSLKKSIEMNLELPASAWYLKRKNYFLGKFLSKGGQYPDPVIRLYLNGKARLPQKNVHEQMAVDGEVKTADGHLLHYPYPAFSSYMRKFNVYTSFEAARQVSEGISISPTNTWSFMIYKPLKTFFMQYFRHKGFVDGMPGFVFALMSSLHHPFVYLKIKEKLS